MNRAALLATRAVFTGFWLATAAVFWLSMAA